jgi:hypothetical protein
MGITVIMFRFSHLVFSIYDSTKAVIQKMIEASQRMLTMNSPGGKRELTGGIIPLSRDI